MREKVLKIRYSECTYTCTVITPLLSSTILNCHPYEAASNQSPDEGFSIVFTSIEQSLSIFLRVAVKKGVNCNLFNSWLLTE